MLSLNLARRGEPLRVLCLGAHSDDIEIGAGGTILTWIAQGTKLDVHWCVASASGERAGEARASAEAFLEGANTVSLELGSFKDGYFPYEGASVKAWVEDVRSRLPAAPDVILTHRKGDGHQDHREINQLTWNAFRDHVILEYEIPKWDGDLGQPNAYMPLSADILERKNELLRAHFGTQRGKDWFDGETFKGLARLRGMECRAPERYAEGFFVRKLLLG